MDEIGKIYRIPAFEGAADLLIGNLRKRGYDVEVSNVLETAVYEKIKKGKSIQRRTLGIIKDDEFLVYNSVL
ncbi:hypothetical protein J4456_02025 [Candidatus Pacearchaeota archaeon]|nr:hypothetical protein [Candidatus Pacearchaeota archaeon]